jgi:hypothetical protein
VDAVPCRKVQSVDRCSSVYLSTSRARWRRAPSVGARKHRMHVAPLLVPRSPRSQPTGQKNTRAAFASSSRRGRRPHRCSQGRSTGFANPSIKGHHVRQMSADGQLLPGPDAIAVVFQFPHTAEIRYVSRVPARGSRVRSSAGHTFIVTQLLRSGERTFTARCVAPDDTKSKRASPRSESASREREPLPLPYKRQVAEKERRSEHGEKMHQTSRSLEDMAVDLVRSARATSKRFRHRYKMRNYLP